MTDPTITSITVSFKLFSITAWKGMRTIRLMLRILGGPLDQQIVDAFKFVERYNQVSARKEIGRIERSQYSMRAVFEAVVNAVVHRDYSKAGSKIRLFMFTDRLELYSPGALANTLTVDDLRYNQATRNELLARLLSETTLDR